MIKVNPTNIEIHNYDLDQCDKLQRILSVWDSVTFSYNWKAYYYDEEKRVLTIPGGMSVSYIQYLLNNKEIKYGDCIYPKASVFKMNVEPRDDNQRNAINFLLSKEEYKKLSTQNQRMLCLKTGGGKTFCTIYALSKLRTRSIILVDQEKIMYQWRDEILKFTNLHESDIYYITGSDSIDKVLDGEKDINYKIYIASHRTISNYGNKYGWDKITKLFEKLYIGVKVYDEAHIEMKNIFAIDAHTNVRHNIYLTATPGRSDNEEDKVYQNIFKEVPKYGLEEKFDDNYHNIYYVSYNSNPTLTQQSKCSTRYGFDSNTFSDYIFNDEDKLNEFISVIQRLLDLTLKSDKKTALVIKKLDHVKVLKEKLEELYPDTEIGTFCTLIKDLKEREKELDKKLIISTDKSLGKAVNIPNLQYLIMTVPTSSKIVTEQTLGRLRKLDDKKVHYFDVTDVGFDACKRQRQNRKVILNRKAMSIKNLNL